MSHAISNALGSYTGNNRLIFRDVLGAFNRVAFVALPIIILAAMPHAMEVFFDPESDCAECGCYCIASGGSSLACHRICNPICSTPQAVESLFDFQRDCLQCWGYCVASGGYSSLCRSICNEVCNFLDS